MNTLGEGKVTSITHTHIDKWQVKLKSLLMKCNWNFALKILMSLETGKRWRPKKYEIKT